MPFVAKIQVDLLEIEFRVSSRELLFLKREPGQLGFTSGRFDLVF